MHWAAQVLAAIGSGQPVCIRVCGTAGFAVAQGARYPSILWKWRYLQSHGGCPAGRSGKQQQRLAEAMLRGIRAYLKESDTRRTKWRRRYHPPGKAAAATAVARQVSGYRPSGTAEKIGRQTGNRSARQQSTATNPRQKRRLKPAVGSRSAPIGGNSIQAGGQPPARQVGGGQGRHARRIQSASGTDTGPGRQKPAKWQIGYMWSNRAKRGRHCEAIPDRPADSAFLPTALAAAKAGGYRPGLP